MINMSAKSGTPKKNLMFLSGRAHPELAEEVAKHLGVGITPQSAYDFANGEIFVRFEESVRGTDAFVIQSHTAPINQWVMEQLIMVDALKRASAKRITAIMPFYPYARQDKKHKTREPLRPNDVVAKRVVGDVRGRLCVVVDDMVDTGNTIAKAVDQLLEDGAGDVVVAATHGVLSGPAPKLLSQCGAREVIFTNTLPIPESKQFPGLTVLSIAPLLARAIQAVFEDGSV